MPQEVKICRGCIGWLRNKVGVIDVTPTLPVANIDASARFFESVAFDVHRYDDGYAFVRMNDHSVIDLDLVLDLDPTTNHAGCYIITNQVDDWHGRFVEAGLQVTPVSDMPWGMHEFTLTDLDGNSIRVGWNS